VNTRGGTRGVEDEGGNTPVLEPGSGRSSSRRPCSRVCGLGGVRVVEGRAAARVIRFAPRLLARLLFAFFYASGSHWSSNRIPDPHAAVSTVCTMRWWWREGCSTVDQVRASPCCAPPLRLLLRLALVNRSYPRPPRSRVYGVYDAMVVERRAAARAIRFRTSPSRAPPLRLLPRLALVVHSYRRHPLSRVCGLGSVRVVERRLQHGGSGLCLAFLRASFSPSSTPRTGRPFVSQAPMRPCIRPVRCDGGRAKAAARGIRFSPRLLARLLFAFFHASGSHWSSIRIPGAHAPVPRASTRRWWWREGCSTARSIMFRASVSDFHQLLYRLLVVQLHRHPATIAPPLQSLNNEPRHRSSGKTR
jgi:hypothetical protein